MSANLISDERKREIIEEKRSSDFKYRDLERRVEKYERLLSSFSLRKEHPLVKMVYQLTDMMKITSEYNRLNEKKQRIEENVLSLEETMSVLQGEANSLDEKIKMTKQMYDDSKCVVMGNESVLREVNARLDEIKRHYNSLQEQLEDNPESLKLMRESNEKEAEISEVMSECDQVEDETMLFSMKLKQFENSLNHYMANKERLLLQLEASRESCYACKLEIENLDLILEERTNPVNNARLLITSYNNVKDSDDISSLVYKEGTSLIEGISNLNGFEKTRTDYERLRDVRKKKREKTIHNAKKKIKDDAKKRFENEPFRADSEPAVRRRVPLFLPVHSGSGETVVTRP